jgi:hypothetical protein
MSSWERSLDPINTLLHPVFHLELNAKSLSFTTSHKHESVETVCKVLPTNQLIAAACGQSGYDFRLFHTCAESLYTHIHILCQAKSTEADSNTTLSSDKLQTFIDWVRNVREHTNRISLVSRFHV